MAMRTAQRVRDLPPYLFVEISRKIAEQREQGVRVISFGIGDPDLPTHPHILDALHEHADVPANHRYPETEGLPELRECIARWMSERFEVSLDPATEIVPLIGAKEGIANTALCFIDPGDVALVPDPAYPVYAIGTMFAGGTSHHLPLTEEHDFLPDLDAIPADVREQARVLWLNYPNNPTGALADVDFFERAARFGIDNEIAVLHDNAYCDVTFDGYEAPAYLQAPSAKAAGMEYFSLSKTFNMTGWRLGWACGHADLVDPLLRVKSNIDSGIPQAIQRMAIAALDGDQSVIEANNTIIQRRRDKVVAALRSIGLEVTNPKASLYIWAKIPEGDTSADFAARLIEEQGVVVTPGNGYGPAGEGYIRLSLTLPDDEVDEGVERIAAFTSQ